MVNSYRICGLSVASEIMLPGLIEGGPESEPQVTIRRGLVPKALDRASRVEPTWQIAEKQFLFHEPDVARFLLNDGVEIVVAPESEARLDDIPIFLLGTVFGILLHQRRQIVLHASAIEVGGKAIVFCGASGAGKSTLAAGLARQGYRVMADDVCAIAMPDDGVPIVHPDGRQLKLWARAIEELKLQANCGARVQRRLDKFYVEPRESASEAIPLGAIYELREAGPGQSIGIEWLNAVDCSVLFQEHAYRPVLVEPFGQREMYFRAAAQIMGVSGLFLLTRPLDFATMPQVVACLEQHWLDIGLTGRSALARAPEKESIMMIQRQGDWLSAKVGDELVMMSATSGCYLGLTEVGVRIWELIETPQEMDALCGKLQEEFDVSDETCRADVEAFLKDLVTHGAIALDPPPVA